MAPFPLSKKKKKIEQRWIGVLERALHGERERGDYDENERNGPSTSSTGVGQTS